MDEKHPKNKDPRPKRRKDRDNPYEIFTIGRNSDNPHFYVAFSDSQSGKICTEITQDLFEQLDKFELEDLSYLNEIDNHYEKSELTEASLNARVATSQESVEEKVAKQILNWQLHNAITQLPEVQRRRLVMYYFENLTYEQIAAKEGCSHPAIMKSISTATRKLQKYFGNIGYILDD